MTTALGTANVSNGSANCGAAGLSGHRNMTHQANTHGAWIHTLGIGAQGSYRAFLQAIALDHSGSFNERP